MLKCCDAVKAASTFFSDRPYAKVASASAEGDGFKPLRFPVSVDEVDLVEAIALFPNPTFF
ncbi:MAG: hypothetical protein NWQ35_11595 [Verrucomicrobiales bacterium]|jgi:hypothetical protein|nr:hypothetical protein [Verrucomicrobiales bacterium]MDP5006490.1 hypothetical protein [Verrucomicrobiales bacterium]